MANFSHSDLVNIGYSWLLKKRCSFAFKELKTHADEEPDLIGFNTIGSFLLEAKASRGDFLADKRKKFRKYPFLGMGDWRFYIAPVGIIKKEDLPRGWGLIEVYPQRVTKVVFNPFGKGNIYSKWKKNQKNEKAERLMLISALRRLHLKGYLTNIYDKQGYKRR